MPPSRKQRAKAESQIARTGNWINQVAVLGAAPMRMVAPRGDRIVAKAVLVKQQRQMMAVAHLAIKRYVRLVRRAVAHEAIRAAAPISDGGAAEEDDLADLGPDVDLNALDQSAAWPDILKSTILPELDKIMIGLGPQNHMSPSVVMAVDAWRASWMQARTQVLMGVPDQITRQIRDAITASTSENGPNPAHAANIVSDLLNPDADTWANRAMTIARTEVVGANNQGGLAAYTAVHQSLGSVGGKVYKTWLATEDAVTRPDHADIDGTEIAVDDTFDVGGSPMNGPGDENADGGETINCRCTLTYRIDDGTDNGDAAEQVDDGSSDAVADDGAEAEDSGDNAMTAAAPAAAPAAADPTAPYEPAPYHRDADENVICPSCGLADSVDAIFCDQCGFELKGADDVVVDPPADDAAAGAMTAAGPPVAPPQPSDGTPSEAAVPAAAPGAVQWTGTLGLVDQMSSDGRMIAAAGFVIRQLPLPLKYQCEGEHGGEEAGKTEIVGRILTCTVSGAEIIATGDFLDPMISMAPASAIEQVAAGIGFVSVDLPVQEVSYAAPGPDGVLIPIDPMQYMGDPDMVVMVAQRSELAGATIVDTPAFGAARIEISQVVAPNLAPVVADAATPEGPTLTADSITFPDGTVIKVGDEINIAGSDAGTAPSTALVESIDPASNTVTVAVDDPDNAGQTITITVDASALTNEPDAADNASDAASGAATPSVGGPSGGADGVAAAGGLTAALAFPGLTEEHVYPSEWFDPIQLDGPTRIQVSDDGRVFGHLAEAGTCHIGFANQCVAMPELTEFPYFHVGDVKTDKGLLAVGKLTVGGGHADLNLGWRGTVEHYDNAGACAAVVRAYRDEWGTLVVGALVPQATGPQVAALRRNELSGDWRPIGGHRELVAALSVNTGGFKITPRAALAADGRPAALVAAGVVHATEDAKAAIVLPSGAQVSTDDLALIASVFADELDRRQSAASTAASATSQVRALRRKLARDRLNLHAVG